MKVSRFRLLLTTGILLSLGGAFASHAVPGPTSGYDPGTYQVDPVHSKVGFEIPHLVISTVEGKFTKFDGTVSLVMPFNKSTVKATADVNSIDTSSAKRDDHLRSGDFFDASKHPTMTFESTSIAGTPQSFKMTGNLTIKGTTKSVVFDSKYLGTVNDGMGNQKVAFTATTVINRRDFGLTWNKAVEAGPVVGNMLTISLKIQAARPAPPAATRAQAPAASGAKAKKSP